MSKLTKADEKQEVINPYVPRNQHIDAEEQYTRYTDIEKELIIYTDCFKAKTIYCNCDDPDKSHFVEYFRDHFKEYGLKKFIATCLDVYATDGKGKYLIITADGEEAGKLQGDGDFRSEECVEFLKEADIVVTQPVGYRRLIKDYVAQLIDYNKQFILLWPVWAVEYFHADDMKIYCKRIKTIYYEVPDDYTYPNSTCDPFGNGKKYVKMDGEGWIRNINSDNYAHQIWHGIDDPPETERHVNLLYQDGTYGIGEYKKASSIFDKDNYFGIDVDGFERTGEEPVAWADLPKLDRQWKLYIEVNNVHRKESDDSK